MVNDTGMTSYVNKTEPDRSSARDDGSIVDVEMTMPKSVGKAPGGRVATSIAGMNWLSISRQLAESLATINRLSISRQLAESLATINRPSISRQLAESLATINRPSISRQLAESLATSGRQPRQWLSP